MNFLIALQWFGNKTQKLAEILPKGGEKLIKNGDVLLKTCDMQISKCIAKKRGSMAQIFWLIISNFYQIFMYAI